MYTIGQIANIMGISKDKLRYYEEKGILKPVQNDDNSYRQYDLKDIDTILAIEFYRSLNLEFKTIKKLHEKCDIKDIEGILNKKYKEVMKEIDRLKAIAARIEKAKHECNDIEKCLNNFSIRPMAPVKVLEAISDFRAYNEFEVIHQNKNQLDEAPIIKSLKRFITFNDKGIETNKMLITKDIDLHNEGEDYDILQYEKCAYTIVQDGEHIKNVMEDTFTKSLEWIYINKYSHKGIAVIGMLFIEHHEGSSKSYLEVFIPIE